MKKPLFFSLLFCCCTTLLAQPATASDCYETFFNNAAKIRNTATVKLVVGKKVQSLASYVKQNASGLEHRMGLKDLDDDGRAELVMYNFTGGAHCCDEFYIFKAVGANKYKLAATLFAGNTCVDGNTFLFDFAEPFGYLFTCYACELEEKKNSRGDTYARLASIRMKYKDGKLLVEPGDAVLKEKLLQNLRYIKALGWDGGVKEGEFDDGRRKALAQTLAVYYFSFGKNAANTKTLFATYYPYKDAPVLWKAFSDLLTGVQSQNSF